MWGKGKEREGRGSSLSDHSQHGDMRYEGGGGIVGTRRGRYGRIDVRERKGKGRGAGKGGGTRKGENGDDGGEDGTGRIERVGEGDGLGEWNREGEGVDSGCEDREKGDRDRRRIRGGEGRGGVGKAGKGEGGGRRGSRQAGARERGDKVLCCVVVI